MIPLTRLHKPNSRKRDGYTCIHSCKNQFRLIFLKKLLFERQHLDQKISDSMEVMYVTCLDRETFKIISEIYTINFHDVIGFTHHVNHLSTYLSMILVIPYRVKSTNRNLGGPISILSGKNSNNKTRISSICYSRLILYSSELFRVKALL